MFTVTSLLSLLSTTIHIAAILFLLTLVLTHLWSKFRMRSKPVVLNVDSVVIITGGCMGIGRVMALEIARLYHCVIIIVDKRRDLFEEVSEAVRQHDAACQCYYTDLADFRSVDKFITKIKSAHKQVHLLVYNAGVFIPGKTWELTAQNHEEVMNVNYFTPIRIIQGLFPLLRGQHIAVVASLSSIVHGAKNISAYIASKQAIFSYVNSLRQQLLDIKSPTTISMACPYVIDTGMFQGIQNRLGFIFPTLKEGYVGKRLVEQFINKKQVIYIHRHHAILFKILSFFPTFFYDQVTLFCDNSNFDELMKKRKTKLAQ